MGECNFCTLRGMKQRARANGDGERVITMPGTPYEDGEGGSLPAGVNIFTVPAGVSRHDLKTSAELRKRYGGSWFMALTDHC